MEQMSRIIACGFGLLLVISTVGAEGPRVEVSSDGHERVELQPLQRSESIIRDEEVPFPLVPDWSNTLRRQVGGLQVADMNGDGWPDVVVGCYISNSYPPYDDWENLIYFNNGGELEADPSWVSADEVSTGDVQVALINDDEYLDVFAANGGTSSFGDLLGRPRRPEHHARLGQRRTRRRLEQLRDALRFRSRR